MSLLVLLNRSRSRSEPCQFGGIAPELSEEEIESLPINPNFCKYVVIVIIMGETVLGFRLETTLD